MEMGATVYLYQLAGYRVGVTVAAPEPAQLNQLEQAKLLAKLATEQVERLTFLQDKPGLAAKMELAHQEKALMFSNSFAC